MSHSQDLLGLIHEFPQAFTDPEATTQKPKFQTNSLAGEDRANQTILSNSKYFQESRTALTAKTQQLLQLIAEFPQAFVDPESAQPELEALAQSSNSESSTSVLPTPETQQSVQPEPTPELRDMPAGYAYALRRRVSTLTWGQVDFNLTYGAAGLAEIWITVGKSGTEVQSLGEAIARLINRLLAQQVLIPEIVREIRGIRGGDSEGLGPHRILGLADLIGKVLQEAPDPEIAVNKASSANPVGNVAQATANSELESISSEASTWTQPPKSFDELIAFPVSASLCPECGAELSQTNGCKGGACIVCGYSSCS